MLIKKDKQLQKGDIIKFNGDSLQYSGKKKTYDVIVREVYSHWVLGEVLDFEHIDDVVLKVSMTNVELLQQGIYKISDIEGNSYGIERKPELTEEQIQKLKEYNKIHNTKIKFVSI